MWWPDDRGRAGRRKWQPPALGAQDAVRATARAALVQCMCILIGILHAILPADDPRWRNFALNLPAAHTAPGDELPLARADRRRGNGMAAGEDNAGAVGHHRAAAAGPDAGDRGAGGERLAAGRGERFGALCSRSFAPDSHYKTELDIKAGAAVTKLHTSEIPPT